jgi:undecaprenyl-diphosphatase
MIDLAIAQAINHLGAGSILDYFTTLVSDYIFLVLVLTLIVALIWLRDKKKVKIVVVALIIVLFLHFLITGIVMKDFVANNIYFKERPYLSHPNAIGFLGTTDADTAFPSGHVAMTVGILTVLIFYYRKYWPYALIFALFMAFARIHNGMHYPSDVLFGALFGIVYGLSAIYLSRRFFRKLSK